MDYTIQELAEIVGGTWRRGHSEVMISHLAIDSRKLSLPSQALFFALTGKNHDGHRFIHQAYNAGVRVFVVEQMFTSDDLEEAHFIQVNDSLGALQHLAALHRAKFHYPVIGITGSNGKTVVKEWLNTLLADDYRIVRNPRSYNSQVGVPLSVWNMDEDHTLGIFEAGISMPGEMEKLQKMIHPDIGIFLNIGQAHLENFQSAQALAEEKAFLFRSCATVIASADYPVLNNAIAQAMPAGSKIVTWSKYQENVIPANLQLQACISSGAGSLLQCTWQGVPHAFEIQFADDASIENALACIATLLHMGLDSAEIATRLSRLTPVAMRLELVSASNNSVVVNDAYNSDVNSLEIALDFLQQQAHGKRKIVILSDITQSGWTVEILMQKIDRLLTSSHIEYFYGIGKEIKKSAYSFSIPHRLFESTEEFLAHIGTFHLADAAILVKGARDFRMERIVAALAEQTHDTVLEINLNALSHNLNYFRSRLSPGVKLLVMVKAFGYGSGAREVAGLLEFNKIDYLAVAYTDEGVQLRNAGISLPIMVMNAEKSSLEILIKHRLEPVIYSMRTMQNFLDALTDHQFKPYPIHLKMDTGMHRLGFTTAEMDALCTALEQHQEQVKVESVFTHLAAADEPQHDDFTNGQLALFDQLCADLQKTIRHEFLKHAANTAGIQRFPQAQYHMVRLGIGLYGVAAHPKDQLHLQHVGTLKTVISQIKKIKAGESVGYGRSFIATADMTIATIPLGYADGLRRTLSNGIGEVLIHHARCKVVGRVCMDMMMVDVSHIRAQEGDEVIIFGQDPTLIELAQKCGTIAYEMLTSISSRVKRVYLSE